MAMKPSKHLQATLRDWRPTLPNDLRSLAPDRAVGSDKLIAGALKRLNLGERLNEKAIFEAWAEIAGPLASRHSQPRSMRNGVLYVTVSNSTLLSQLRTYDKPVILKRLRAKFGQQRIREIVFWYQG